MKKHVATLAVALAVLCTTAPAYATPTVDDDPPEAQIAALNTAAKAAMNEARWDAFSNTLVQALQSKHDGLKGAAMRMVIQHGDQVNVKPAVFDVMRVYRDHDDENMRRLAVVALGEMNNRWAIRFLSRSLDFEKSPTVRRTMKAVISG